VRQELRDQVRAAIRELKYRPNGTARAMRTARTGNIGLVVPRLINPLHPALLHVVGGAISRAGFRAVVWSTDDMDEKAAADAVRESLVDGIIMTAATTASTQLYEAVQLKAPVVLVNRVVDGWPCDQVASDNVAGARMVAEYLLNSGRRRIGMVGGISLASSICQRQMGFREMLASRGQPLEGRLCELVEQFSYHTGFEAVARLLDLAEPPDTLFCVNDFLALGARDAARQRGFNVPGDLWIVGYDDIEMASWHAFDLTTVRQPLAQMAELAVQFLLERISGYEGEVRNVRLPNHLVLRGSTSRRITATSDKPQATSTKQQEES
jgi:LacI family transcriptional regulator